MHTLGGLHLESAARQQSAPLVLLTYLALEGPQERRSVQELFFPGHADGAGRLRMMVHRLRHAAPGALDTPGTRLVSTLECDAGRLMRAAERQDAAEVLALYQGKFLDGVRLPGDAELEEWVFSMRERLAARVRTSLLALGCAAALRHEAGQALSHAERAYMLPGAPEPDRDEACRLALLLTATGSAFAADARAETRRLGVTLPEQAADALAALQPGAARQEPAGPPGGLERRRPAGDTAPVTTDRPDARTDADGPLPPLLGREDALAHLDASLNAGTRLVTILGQGGVGKTLLARHVLQRALQRGADRDVTPALMVDLSDTHDPAAVMAALAGRVHARSAALQDVAQALAPYDLLILDNFEQVLPAANDVSQLLHALPHLRVLVTSRERLHLAQEAVLPLDGLSLDRPVAEDGEPGWSDAARLFVRRATRASLNFTPDEHRHGIESVCALVRGVPLLIELASAWVRTLKPAEIAAQLDSGILRGADLTQPDLDLLETRDRDVLPRHASARMVLEASWQRLAPQEQERLGRLAVFLADFTPRAARQVTGATLSDLAALTDKSWLSVGTAGLGGTGPGGGRLRWHPLARAFVREQAQAAWQGVLHRHALHFAQSLNAGRFQGGQVADLLDEWPDIGQAARTLAHHPHDWPLLTTLAREAPRWADQVGNYASVAGLMGRVLQDLPPDAAPRGHVLRSRAALRIRMHQLPQAREDFRAAADLLLQSGDTQELMQGMDALAVLHHQAGEYEQAEAIWLDINRQSEALQLLSRQAYTLNYLGVNAVQAGRLQDAETWMRAAIRAGQRLPLGGNHVQAHASLGRILTRLGRRAEAHVALTDGLKLAQDLQATAMIPGLLNHMALNLLDLQRPAEAVRLCLDALALDLQGQPGSRAEMLDTLAQCLYQQGDEQRAAEELATCVQIGTQLHDPAVLLHRLHTYTVIRAPHMTPEDHAALLHWLLGRATTDSALRELVLGTLQEDVQPALCLPQLDPDIFPPDAQRQCGYVPGSPTLQVHYDLSGPTYSG
ncbi:transcriptional activator [Deinococcus aquiradiocola]|uniref:Transcriptional activator n=1 Tax=Deinococcus aquiradiocola TaxID=393059 RepID=A0A917UT17_9DEIO|nr:transcriptional activator [Deinococcus aquiradiocola]